MINHAKGNVLPTHVRNAIRAYLKQASPDRPVVISSAMREIPSLSEADMSEHDLTTSIALEAIDIGLNIHFDRPPD